MKKSLIYLLLFVPCFLSYGQSGFFTSLGGGGDFQFNSLALDTITNKLYVSGQFKKLNGYFSADGQAVWDGTKWDSIRHILGDSVHAFKKINGVIYCYGSILLKLNSTTGVWTKIASTKWAGGAGGINGLASYQNKLIIYGVFDSINNQPIKMVASFDGLSFNPLGNEPFSAAITTACEFQGKLYLGGVFAFNASCGTIYRLAVWDGSCWKQFGNGIQGGVSGVSKLIVYKNKLYVGGAFTISNGNPGNCLFSYDGTNYDNLSGGFTGLNESVSDMFIYKNKLIITGPDLSDLPNSTTQAANFFSFDGNDFCNYFSHQTSLNRFGTIGTYNDTLIFTVATTTVGSDIVKNIAKYMGPFIPQYCVNAVGISESQSIFNQIRIFPNPTSSLLKIHSYSELNLDTYSIEIINSIGQIVIQTLFKSEIDVSNLNAGCYSIRIFDLVSGKNHCSKFIKE